MRSSTLSRCSLLLLAVALGILLRLLFFSVSVQQVQPSSDESIAFLQAEQIAGGEAPVLFMGQPYLFPMESYLLAPLVHALPHNALGARMTALLLNLLAVALTLRVLLRDPRDGIKWPGALLILAPSSYFLMMQSAYALPGYTALSLLSALALFFAQGSKLKEGPGGHAAFAGLFAGLAMSSHMLALPLGVALFAYVALRPRRNDSLVAAGTYALAWAVGTLPHWLAKEAAGEAQASVLNRYNWADSVERIWNPGIKWTLNAATGLQRSTFPDGGAVEQALLPATGTGLIWATLLLSVLALRAVALVHRTCKTRRVSLELPDVMIAVALLTLLTFGMSRRASGESYRYLLPVVWSLPFLFNHLFNALPRLRPVTGSLVVLLTLYNLGSGSALIHSWSQPHFGVKQASQADLLPVLNRLDDLGITRVIGSYGTAYRITFMSEGKVVAAQPQNERFPGWPVPFEAEVHASSHVAYVLTDTIRFLKPSIFDDHLNTEGYGSKREACGDYVLYWDFEEVRAHTTAKALPPDTAQYHASHRPGMAAHLRNGSLDLRWSSGQPQEAGMWLEASLAAPRYLEGLRFHYGRFHHDAAPELDIELYRGGQRVHHRVEPRQFDKFRFYNQHPVYGSACQTVTFPPLEVDTVRLVLSKPRGRFDWSIPEWELLEADGNGTLPTH